MTVREKQMERGGGARAPSIIAASHTCVNDCAYIRSGGRIYPK